MNENLNILLVEDHSDTVNVLAKLLRQCGYDVRTSPTCLRALELATAERFDMLVADLGLPDGDGRDLLRQVRDLYPIRGIAVTGYGTEDDVEETLDAGFDAHLLKPVALDKLVNAIEEIRHRPATGDCEHDDGRHHTTRLDRH